MEVANDVMRPLHDGDNESDSDASDFDAHWWHFVLEIYRLNAIEGERIIKPECNKGLKSSSKKSFNLGVVGPADQPVG